MKKLSENTPVTIGVLIATGTFAVGWGSVKADVQRLKRDVSVIEKIDRRLSRIEGALGIRVPREDQKSWEDFENDE